MHTFSSSDEAHLSEALRLHAQEHAMMRARGIGSSAELAVHFPMTNFLDPGVIGPNHPGPTGFIAPAGALPRSFAGVGNVGDDIKNWFGANWGWLLAGVGVVGVGALAYGATTGKPLFKRRRRRRRR